MKLKKLGLFLIMASMAVFSACDDDDDKNKTDLALESQGNYKGQLVVTQEGETEELTNASRFISLTRTADNVVKIDLKKLEIKGLLAATDITLNAVELKGESGNVTIENTQNVTLSALNNIEVSVITDGTIIGKKIDLELTIDVTELEIKIKVSFNGEFTEESEDLTDYAAEVASNYKGLLTKTEGSNVEKKDEEVISIEKAKKGVDNEIKLILKDLTLGNKFFGEIVVDEIPVYGEKVVAKESAVVAKTIVKIKETKAKVSPKEGVEWDVVVTGSIEEGVATLKLALVGTDLTDGATLDFNGQSTKEEGAKDDYATKITSNYKGLLNRTAGADVVKTEEIVTIKKVETEGVENTVNLTVKDFILGNQYIGNIVVNDIPVVGEMLVKSEEDITVKLIETSSKFKSEDGKEWDIIVSGVVKAGVATLKLNVTGADLKDGMTLDFSGDVTEEEVIARGKEANILDLKFVAEGKFEVVQQPELKAGSTDLVLTVKYGITDEAKKAMPFTMTVSDGATVLEPLDTKLDLSGEEGAVIKVISQDKKTTKEYTVSLVVKLPSVLYDMEEWVVEYKEGEDASKWFYAPGPEGVWGTSNQGAVMATSGALGVTKEEKDMYSGKGAVKIETFQSSFMLGDLIPKVTPGSLFMGYFKLNIGKPLTSTNFGISFDEKPISASGYYKYKAGDLFLRVPEGGKKSKPVEEPDTKDKCSINAILYEISSDEDAYITGDKTYEDPRIVAKAMFSSGDTNGYQPFSVNFDYVKAYDKSKKYRLAIIASSSAEGDTYSGAPGSVLYLDDIEVTYEVE